MIEFGLQAIHILLDFLVGNLQSVDLGPALVAVGDELCRNFLDLDAIVGGNILHAAYGLLEGIVLELELSASKHLLLEVTAFFYQGLAILTLDN